jgi:hypothetical protein
MPSTSSEPWGHKLTVHVYVEGSLERAMDVSDKIADMDLPEIDFMGIGVSDVAERPRDQDGS